jgi:hypothetical protein
MIAPSLSARAVLHLRAAFTMANDNSHKVPHAS